VRRWGAGGVWEGFMYNRAEIFVSGIACGAAVVLFALLALWLHRKDAALSLHQQARQYYFFAKGMVWAGCGAVDWAVVAVVGAVSSIFALPHLEWVAGIVVGVGLPLALRWLWRRRGVERERADSLRPPR
jgi:hypothetical protein